LKLTEFSFFGAAWVLPLKFKPGSSYLPAKISTPGLSQAASLNKGGIRPLSVLSIYQLTVEKRAIKVLSTGCSKSESNQIKRKSKRKDKIASKESPQL
jgi:hypothetical protein